MKLFAAAAVIAALGFTSCTSTSIAHTWKMPGLKNNPLHKIAVFASIKDEGIRRTIEDRFVQKLGVPAVQAYRLATPQAAGDVLHERLLEEGFDGTIVVRLVSVKRQAEWVPGMWPGTFYEYGSTWDPGEVEVDTYVRIETNVYKLPDEQLIWATTSQSVNPANVNRMIDETVDVVVKAMRKDALLPEPQKPVALNR